MKCKTALIFALTAVLTMAASVFSVSASGNDVVVFDSKNAWTDSSVIDLFERNEFDDQLVYPGVNGYYTFTVRNISDTQKECEVIISDDNKFSVPLDVRIKRDGKYIIGSENEWANSASFDSSTYLIDPKSDNVYELEWKWDFYNSESEDQRDTKLGVNAHFENEPYNVKIKVLAESEPEINSEPNLPKPDKPGDPPTTGESRNLWIPVSVGVISLGTAILTSNKKNHTSLQKG